MIGGHALSVARRGALTLVVLVLVGSSGGASTAQAPPAVPTGRCEDEVRVLWALSERLGVQRGQADLEIAQLRARLAQATEELERLKKEAAPSGPQGGR